MKHFYPLIFLLLPTILFSQDITQEVDAKLQLLNKAPITTDILYDRVYPMADLVAFNSTAPDTSHARHFFQAYSELQHADYNSRWNSLQTFRAAVENQASTIPIGIINVDFQYLDEEAIADNLLNIQGADSLLVDVPSRPRSVYFN